jgi:two-component system, OmpR family, response regulator
MTAVTTKPRVLVVEDDAPIRASLDITLRGEGYAVRAEADGSAIRRVSEEFRPDLAILDVHLPAGPDGCGIARRLREVSNLPLLFLTAADSHEERRAGFDAGADDYLIKPFSMDELMWRVKALLRRSGKQRSPVRQVGDIILDEEARTVQRSGKALDLTRTEFQLLDVLTRHGGHVLSKTQLLTQVWGFDAHDTNLVEVHMSSLRRKLERHGERLIHTVRAVGYVLRP